MLYQPSQVWMREVLRRGDLGLYANLPSAIEVQLQSYNVTRGCAVCPRSPGRPENYSLATSSNLVTNDVAPTQRSFYFSRDKLAGIPMDSHTIYQLRYMPPVSHDLGHRFNGTEPVALPRRRPRLVKQESGGLLFRRVPPLPRRDPAQ
jgi:hypothetical protein